MGAQPNSINPSVKDVNGQLTQHCGNNKHDVIGNIGALGAGDFGADGLSDVWNLFAEWARSDKGQKALMTVGSVVEIAGGIALTVATAGTGGVLIAALGAGMVGGGVSSLIGGYATEALGGDFKTGWVGGQISGFLTGFGIGTGSHIFASSALQAGASAAQVVKGLAAVVGLSDVGGTLGGGLSSIYTQLAETGNVDINRTLKSGLISGSLAAMSWPFSIVSSALSSAGASAASTTISLVEEGIFDTSSYFAGMAA